MNETVMRRLAWMSQHTLPVFRLACCLIWAGFIHCGCSCGDDAVLASADEVFGSVGRDFASSQNRWITAAVGAEFRVGDGIQSNAGAGAVLALGDGSFAKLVEKTRIRFYALTDKGQKSSRKIEVETGELELTVGAEDFTLETGLGIAKIKTGSRVRIRRTKTGADFAVDIGTAVFYDKENRAVEVGEGRKIALEIGAAVIEPAEKKALELDPAGKPEDTADATSEDSEAVDAEASALGADRDEAGPLPIAISAEPLTPDFVAHAGESFTVHVISPPSAVAFHFGDKCPNEAGVQVAGKWVGRGKETVAALFKSGKHHYRIVCLDEGGRPMDKEIAKGRVVVRRDSGNKRLPNVAPSSFVETDGRNYNILYQTRLPSVTVRWPHAPPGQVYTLSVTSNGKTKKISGKSAEIRLPSGDLQEGVHRLKFEATGSLSRTSRSSEVSIRYDNAAPTAGITAPAEGDFGPGQTVVVSGEFAPGWAVSLSDGTIAQDAQNRFHGRTVFQGNYRAIAIRLSQPRRGIHYYLRRGSRP